MVHPWDPPSLIARPVMRQQWLDLASLHWPVGARREQAEVLWSPGVPVAVGPLRRV